ncbi:beta-ketoacyl synthase N-terminal-like domain-containing protein [Ulvibacter litoralis]|uniref:3-oxoacyl-(Acyl-carrier-protein) synthase n=1 Tax=Ulvibacter litoralis TaxID=227084 RepID=A0A1G7DUC7_9FLAO|nr:beta-ketoacyl synthase N-terminal-like domain-containing protein [Ulvibacter litoralis]GHC42387.1 3-oxoacyl-ACP synthase [Ulvibacter litoralis]SDE54726.1 3-oxoacyl-(acyl-carrier-protein) synthase [Ulvibacter litoralis]
MKKVYINSIGSISAQKTFENASFLETIADYNDTVLPAIDPVYKDYIPPAAARRMAKGIKMGVVASKIALAEANLENVDAVITGTGMGCVVDSEKFVSAIIDNNEEYLTPTSFIQSTHNTVGGQIALGLGCNGYNFTYVHASISFESALLDAKMQLETEEAENILVGGVDELGAHTVKIHRLINHIKPEAVTSKTVLNSKTSGAVFSEGANFFVLSNLRAAQTYAELLDVKMFNTLEIRTLSKAVLTFLQVNGLFISDVDLIILGNNGDVAYDTYYHELTDKVFAETPQATYKQLSGEFHTASSFGLWMASKIMKSQSVPEAAQLNTIQTSEVNTILLYNQYRGENHSLTLLRHVEV